MGIVTNPCISCKFMHGDTGSMNPPICMHADCEEHTPDYVLGTVKVTHPTCRDMRAGDGLCGYMGKLYQGRKG